MNASTAIRGHKSEDGPRQPVETADSLHSTAIAKVVDLISEGEIEGLVDGLKSIYFNETPLQNADGTFNFQDVTVEVRNGTQTQDHLAGFPSIESELGVGVELTTTTPFVRAITNPALSAVRVRVSVPALQKQDLTSGDTTGYSVSYAIDLSTNGGAYVTVVTAAFTGKTTTKYERSHRLELPAGTSWQLRVRRLTADTTAANIADTTVIESVTEVIDAKLRRPNSALVASRFSATQFQAIPTRAFRIRGLRIKVPTNYNPATRVYTGIWDGTFKIAWTNNPAWVYYDLATNPRYGLGHLVTGAQVDRYRLYQIAQYCDQLVADGFGGTEPRFTCNAYLQTQGDATKVLQDLASVFRGISFYGGGAIVAVADQPSDAVYTYTAANVLDGRFTYSGSSRKVRHTVALVSWNDLADFGRPKVEPVEYRPGVLRYGIQPISLTGFGCTSRGQAARIGAHVLFSENLETETVSFSVGLDGLLCGPGDVIQVADPARAGRRTGGRVSSAVGRAVTLDAVPATLAAGHSLRCALPTGKTESRTVESVAGRVVTVTAAYSVLPQPEAVWAVEFPDLKTQTFRVLQVVEGEGIDYQITALKHVPGKFALIDNGTKLEAQPISITPPGIQRPPTAVTLTSHSVVEQGINTHVLSIDWDQADGAVAYDVEWRRGDNDWVKAGQTPFQQLEVRGIYAGVYVARVRAINALNVASIPAVSTATTIEGKTTPPPALTSLVASSAVFGINLTWGFPVGATDTERTEIWYSPANVLSGATKLGDFAYPQAKHSMMGLAAGVTFFFWGRLVDRSGNIGPFYPVANGVVGQSSSDAAAVLSYLTGQITATQLAAELLSPLAPPVAGSATDYAGSTTKFAGVYSQQYASEAADGVAAGRIDSVLAVANGAAAQVTVAQTAISGINGKLAATYSVKAQVSAGGLVYAAGMGLGVEQLPDGSYQSQFLVLADRFAILNTASGVTSTPFVISGGQVFIQSAFIADASITNAKIGGVIQSTALGAGGLPRWKLDKAGTLTMTGPNAGSGWLTITDSTVEVFDGAGTRRVRLGIW